MKMQSTKLVFKPFSVASFLPREAWFLRTGGPSAGMLLHPTILQNLDLSKAMEEVAMT